MVSWATVNTSKNTDLNVHYSNFLSIFDYRDFDSIAIKYQVHEECRNYWLAIGQKPWFPTARLEDNLFEVRL